MSKPTESRQFGRRLEAAALRRKLATATTPQPALVPPTDAAHRSPGAVGAAWPAFDRRLREGWAWLAALFRRGYEQQRSRRLRVVETVGLGEKRLLAIVRVRDEEFLVGSAPSGLTLLTRLSDRIAASAVEVGDLVGSAREEEAR